MPPAASAPPIASCSAPATTLRPRATARARSAGRCRPWWPDPGRRLVLHSCDQPVEDGWLQELGQLIEQLALALGADQALLQHAVVEDQQRGDAHDLVATGHVGRVVD